MASVFKRRRKRTKEDGSTEVVESRKYTILYRNASGEWQRVLGYADKAKSWELARKLEDGEAESKYVRYGKVPLSEHLKEFKASLSAGEATAKHVKQTCNRVKKLIEGCGFVRIRDLDAPKVASWLESQRRREEKPIGIQTSNYYLASIQQFSRWLAENGRAPNDPLTLLSTLNAKTDVRRKRRKLSDDEFAKFIKTTLDQGEFRGLTGRDRSMLYFVSANTGLRAGELESLTVDSFDLGDQPRVTVEAAYSKRRRRDTLPLRADVAEALRGWIKDRSGRVWPGTWKERASWMIRADLEAAEIPYELNGKVFDFHDLRHQLISSLAKAGVHPKTAQELARHSTIVLTMDHYSHLDTPDLVAGLNMLPRIPVQEWTQEIRPSVSANRVEVPNTLPVTSDSENAPWTQKWTQERGSGCPEVAQSDSVAPLTIKGDGCSQTLVLQELGVPCPELTWQDINSGGGTRTPDTRIMIPKRASSANVRRHSKPFAHRG